MPTIIVCRACGESPEGYTHEDAESGLVPEDECLSCGSRSWAIWDVDPSEVDEDGEDGFYYCPACDSELTESENDERECWDCGEAW